MCEGDGFGSGGGDDVKTGGECVVIEVDQVVGGGVRGEGGVGDGIG